MATNEILNINKLMLELLEYKEELPSNELSQLNIFSNFEDYLDLKSSCNKNKNLIKKMITVNTFHHKEKIIEAQANYFVLGYKKYMGIIFNDKNDYFETIRYFGVFSSIVEESPDGVIISRYTNFSDVPTIMYTNKSLTNLTGYNCAELVGKPLFNLFHLNVDENTLVEIEKNIKLFKPTTIEYQYIKKNGEISWVESDIIPITNLNINNSIINVCQNKEYTTKIDGAINSFQNYNNEIYITIHQKNITKAQEYENSSKSYIEKIKKYYKR